MSHPFFADLNWKALENREIEAEYKPDLNSIEEEQKNNEDLNQPPMAAGEPKLLGKDQNSSAAAAAGSNKDGDMPLGHSILDEDARDVLS